MEIVWSGWLVGSLIVYIVILAISVWVAATVTKKAPGLLFMSVASFIILTSLANLTSHVLGPTEWKGSSSVREISHAFGLEHGKNYPLVMGDRVGGSAGHAVAVGGLFYARAVVDLQPASALSIGFSHGDKSYVLELPMSQITFVQSTAEDPSVELHLHNNHINDDSETYNIWSDECTTALRNLFFRCLYEREGIRVELDSDTERRGLAPIVQGSFDSATITLTPDMYYDLLGAEQPKREE